MVVAGITNTILSWQVTSGSHSQDDPNQVKGRESSATHPLCCCFAATWLRDIISRCHLEVLWDLALRSQYSQTPFWACTNLMAYLTGRSRTLSRGTKSEGWSFSPSPMIQELGGGAEPLTLWSSKAYPWLRNQPATGCGSGLHGCSTTSLPVRLQAIQLWVISIS